MEQPLNFYISDSTSSISSIQPVQNSIVHRRLKRKKCNECNQTTFFDINHQICDLCYKTKIKFKPEKSGNKVIDDFIKYTQINRDEPEGKLEFVPYYQFKNIEFIAEGGFSKIYKANWIDGPINYWYKIKHNRWKITRNKNYIVVLKKLNNSKNITSKELNELKVFYQIYSDQNADIDYISKYFGITQDPITKDIIFIMPYYDKGDLMHYLSDDFYNKSWETKLDILWTVTVGLCAIHFVGITHRDLHSGNIFFNNYGACIGDLGISKSATECTDNNNENYGIIPYMAPEIFQGQKYTKASDIYSFGMIMWEFMTGRRPFWDRNHDTDLIIDICDGLRPSIGTNAPKGYIELMKKCWHSDPNKRPTTADLGEKIWYLYRSEEKISNNKNPTEIIKSSDIGPVTTNNPGAIYKSRPLSGMINTAMSLRNSRNRSIDPFYYYQKNNAASIDKRKFGDSIEDGNDNDQNFKRRKLFGNVNSDYFTKEIELDINKNLNQSQNNGYVTKEFGIDINNITSTSG